MWSKIVSYCVLAGLVLWLLSDPVGFANTIKGIAGAIGAFVATFAA
jgi:hypothetical protein